MENHEKNIAKVHIFITRIDKLYEETLYTGEEYPIRKMTGYKVYFFFKTIESNITIHDYLPMTEEEIKDKIMEVLK